MQGCALGSARLRRLSFAFGTSMMAMGAAIGAPAAAQCIPDPTQTGQTTTCIGNDRDGIAITTTGSTVDVINGASVHDANAAAITVDIPVAGSPYAYYARTAAFLVESTVSGDGQAGIAVFSGDLTGNSYDFYGTSGTSGTSASLTVAAGGVVTGTTGITAGPSASNSAAPALLTIDNAGSISGTGGLALQAITPGRGGFTSIANRAGGTIGAIGGQIGALANAGTIDGGMSSAIDEGTTYNYAVYGTGIVNSGTIRSSSNTVTIANVTSRQQISNSGTIANAGSGGAIGGAYLTITNAADSTISSAGSTAIEAANGLSLTNAGRTSATS